MSRRTAFSLLLLGPFGLGCSGGYGPQPLGAAGNHGGTAAASGAAGATNAGASGGGAGVNGGTTGAGTAGSLATAGTGGGGAGAGGAGGAGGALSPVSPPACDAIGSEPTIPTACATVLATKLVTSGSPSDETLDTAAIQAAITACPAGQAVRLATDGDHTAFVSGGLVLKPGVSLWLDTGTTLFASHDPRDFDAVWSPSVARDRKSVV